MTASKIHFSNIPFSSEAACVSYLFRKRWPDGFLCPFCNVLQKETAPAYVVVCRYCRKQTSITAHTLMHGSKKSLASWMRVAWQFCLQDDGMSAKELQRLMELSCYQTAWSWLQKIRCGAALAESDPCRGIVLCDLAPLPVTASSKRMIPDICMIMELDHSHGREPRVRLASLASSVPPAITAVVNNLLDKNSTLLIQDREWLTLDCHITPDLQGQPTGEQLKRGQLFLQATVSWLNSLYRGAIDPWHLQAYLDEFCFRHNTSSWPDKLSVLDHLLNGLLSSSVKHDDAKRKVIRGGWS